MFLFRRSPSPPQSDTDVFLRTAATTVLPYPSHTTLSCPDCEDVRWAAAGGLECFVCGAEGVRAA